MAKNKPEKIGKKYGKLFVKDYDYENNLYICECECGNIFKTKSSNLRKENDKRGIKQCEECSLNKKNISFPKKINKKYGKLTVKEYLGNKEYRCECECGNTCIVKTSDLREDKRRCKLSCGCDKLHYNKNKDFFKKIDTEEKAYILGFLAADGNINDKNNNIKITLNSIDCDILEKIKKEMEYDGPIKNKEITTTLPSGIKHTSCVSELVICSEEIVKDLIALGITPKKSLTLNFNFSLLEESMIKHFLRGYVDGDGSCNITSCNNKINYKISITSSSLMINSIKKVIKEIFPQFRCSIVKSKTNEKTSTLYVGGKNSFELLLNYLYKDATFYLDRKYNLYLKNIKILKLIKDGYSCNNINFNTGNLIFI